MSDSDADSRWLRTPVTDVVEVARRYDAWASTYDQTLRSWNYEAPEVAAQLMHDELTMNRSDASDRSDRRSHVGEILEVGVTEGGMHEVAHREVGMREVGMREVDMREVGVQVVVLDIGCGTGLTGAALRGRGIEIIDGLDLSSESLAIARSRNVYRSLLQHDFNAEPLPFADGTYVGVECIGVMSYVHEPQTLLREMHRVVKISGTIVFSHRTDLWEHDRFPELMEELSDDGLFSDVTWTDPMPYMPNNVDFADRVLVRYVVVRTK
jgi:SAM-dependent methyltransferase